SKGLYELGIESIPSESVCYPAKLVHGHVKWLLDRGVKTVFYPGIVYERPDILAADESYSCPIVASYCENIKNNMEELREDGITFLNPFFSFKNKKALVRRIASEFAAYGVTRAEAQEAVDLGWKAWD